MCGSDGEEEICKSRPDSKSPRARGILVINGMYMYKIWDDGMYDGIGLFPEMSQLEI